MDYGNGTGGVCACGRAADVACQGCGRGLCSRHARALPAPPAGVSANARGRYELASRHTDGPHCEPCRAEIGNRALAQEIQLPRAMLPDHWLDRAIALSGDQTRSEQEKLHDAALPPSLKPPDVAAEFLRRIERPPQERVPITPPRLMRAPEYIDGWSVDGRRTTYRAGGARYPLPCFISIMGDLLGPILEDGDRHGVTWWVVPDSDIDLPRLVRSVAQLLVMSAFMPTTPSTTASPR